MSLEILRKIGLSEGEIKIYTALLESGSSPLSKIHEKTGIERRNIYDILNKLIEKGLAISIVENKKRFFQITHPNKIAGYIEEKKDDLEMIKKEVQKHLPSLTARFNSKREDIAAGVFRGVEGIKAVWEDMLNYRTMCWIGSGRYLPKLIPQWFSQWNRRRVKLKIQWYNIHRAEMRKEIKRPYQYEYIKFLPAQFSGNPAVIGIFGNKTANFLFGKQLFAFVIESREIAENYRRYHKYLWENVAR